MVCQIKSVVIDEQLLKLKDSHFVADSMIKKFQVLPVQKNKRHKASDDLTILRNHSIM
jgi:hypothetical protein